MVFDDTVSGMYDALWDPNFMLMVVVMFLTMVVPDTHIVELGMGYMFYNFRLSSVPTN